MTSGWLQIFLAVYLPLNKPYLLSESHLTWRHLISPGGRICQMESLSQATLLICLIFKHRWTFHEIKIAVSSQVWTHWAEGGGGGGPVHLGQLFQIGWISQGMTFSGGCQPAAGRIWLSLNAGARFSASAGLSQSSPPLARASRAVHPCLFHVHAPDSWRDKVDPEDQENNTEWGSARRQCPWCCPFLSLKFLWFHNIWVHINIIL